MKTVQVPKLIYINIKIIAIYAKKDILLFMELKNVD